MLVRRRVLLRKLRPREARVWCLQSQRPNMLRWHRMLLGALQPPDAALRRLPSVGRGGVWDGLRLLFGRLRPADHPLRALQVSRRHLYLGL